MIGCDMSKRDLRTVMFCMNDKCEEKFHESEFHQMSQNSDKKEGKKSEDQTLR